MTPEPVFGVWMPKSVNKMRLSPILVAVFAASATLGLSHSASGQSEPHLTRSQDSLGTLDDLNLNSVLQKSKANVNPDSVEALNKAEGVKPPALIEVEETGLHLVKSTPQESGKNSPHSVNSSEASPVPILGKTSEKRVEDQLHPLELTVKHQPHFPKVEKLDPQPEASAKISWEKRYKSAQHSVEVSLDKSDKSPLPDFELSQENFVEVLFQKSPKQSVAPFEITLTKNDQIKPDFLVQPFEFTLTKGDGTKSNLFLFVDDNSPDQSTDKNGFDSLQVSDVNPIEIAFNKTKSSLSLFSEFSPINTIALSLLEFEPETSFDIVLNKADLAKENLALISDEISTEFVLNKVDFTSKKSVEQALEPTKPVSTQPFLQEPLELAQSPVESETDVPPPQPPTVQPPPPVPPSPRVPTPSQNTQQQAEVLVAEVVISGTEDSALEDLVYDAVSTEPGRTTTRSQLQQDINAIFALGLFRNVRAIPQDTPLGVRITFEVEPNPPLTAVVVEGENVLPSEIVEQSFEGQFNETINLNLVEDAIQNINTWYQENGYVLAQVIAAPEVTPDGTITLEVAEGRIEDIRIRFLNRDGDATDEDGNPVTGRTRDFIITREIELQPGDIFNQRTAQQDLGRVFGLGIFEDVRLQLEPGDQDPRKAVMIVNVIERSTGSLAFGGGVSSATGLFGTLSYQEQNLGGNNHRLGTEVQLGERILLLDLSFTDPWIAGDPYRTSYTANIFRRQAISVIFEQEDNDEDVRLPNGDRPRVVRTGAGISFTRPFAESPFADPEWVASVGFQYQHVQIADSDLSTTPRDDAGKLLSESESGEDDLFVFQFGLARDRRNNRQFPTSGYSFRFGTEQSVPIGSGSIFYNRVRGNYSYYIPINFLQFVPGGPQTIAFNVQGGTIIGDFPPYEAFALGGANTVRGWAEGELGAARSFVLGSVEYRFPVFATGGFTIGGALFVDGATSLGTQSTVPGNPGGIRGKPGSGLGVGAGLRIQSPLGPIRIDYGVNDEGDGRIHFGVGERF